MTEINNELSTVISCALAHIEVERELGEQGILLPQTLKKPNRNKGVMEKQSGLSASSSDKVAKLKQLAQQAERCTACNLHKTRNKSVFSSGSPNAELVFVGEGPGQDEDREGIPFIGQAGQLLDRMIAAMGFERDEVYICNVVKCHPPQNRTPFSEEAQACEHFLTAQLLLVNPRVIVALGKCAALALKVADETGTWRGEWRKWREIPVMPTYHPAFLLRSPKQKRTVWGDLQEVMKKLSETEVQ